MQGVSLCQEQLFSLLPKGGTSSQGAVPVSLPFSSQMESTNCVHRLLCRYIYCIHFPSSNQRLGFAFCPIILTFSEMGTIDPLCFTLIQTLYCWTSTLKCGCRITLSKLEFLCMVSFLIQITSQSRRVLHTENKQTNKSDFFINAQKFLSLRLMHTVSMQCILKCLLGPVKRLSRTF